MLLLWISIALSQLLSLKRAARLLLLRLLQTETTQYQRSDSTWEHWQAAIKCGKCHLDSQGVSPEEAEEVHQLIHPQPNSPKGRKHRNQSPHFVSTVSHPLATFKWRQSHQ